MPIKDHIQNSIILILILILFNQPRLSHPTPNIYP